MRYHDGGFSTTFHKIHHIADLTETDKDTIIGLAEKYVMICCYRNLFCPATTADEEKDLELQNRIRRLNWISTKELNCAINERSQVEIYLKGDHGGSVPWLGSLKLLGSSNSR